MRTLAFATWMLVACAKPQSVSAVTLGGPVAAPAAPIVDHTTERIRAARDAIGHQRLDVASSILLAIVCGDRTIDGDADLARCSPPPGIDATEAWGLIGRLALSGDLVLEGRDWSAAQRIVSRWDHADRMQLAVAEIALARATASITAQTSEWLYALGLAQQRRKECGRALPNFVKVLEVGPPGLHDEALTGAVGCVVAPDWDDDGQDDDVHGFSRSEVHAALAAQKPYIAEIYARALEALLDEDACSDARVGLAELTQRFPTSPAIARLSTPIHNCP